MKYLVILLMPVSLFANWYPLGKTGAKTTYFKSRKQCEKSEKWKCFDITVKNNNKKKEKKEKK